MSKRKNPKKLNDAQRAFVEGLFLKLSKGICSAILSILNSEHRYLFNDCLGELACLMCEKAEELAAHPAPEAWVYVAAKKTALKLIKSESNFQSFVFIDCEGIEVEYTELAFDKLLNDILIESALKSYLTKREYQVFYGLFKESKDTKMVARDLGISESTVRTLKKTAKDKIRKLHEKFK